MDIDWEEEIKKVQERESKNANDAKDVNIDSAMNYIGQWGVPGFTASTGKLFTHNELWEFTHSYKYMQKLANLVDENGNCLLMKGAIKQDKCLELGCDWGHNFITLKSCFEEVYGVEINEDMRPMAESKEHHIEFCMMEHTPFPDDMFDLVISNQTLEHSISADIVLKEIRRVAKPGGYSIHSMPCLQSLAVEEESIIHKTNLNYKQWIEKFKDHGFEIVNHFWGWNHNMEDWTIIARKVGSVK